MLSAYDGVWDAVENIPHQLRAYVTDDIGNTNVEYGGFVQITNAAIFPLLEQFDLFACFRFVDVGTLEHVNVAPVAESYDDILRDVMPIGWDIFTGNGWRSASTDGIFPIDPFTGSTEDVAKVNRFGLIDAEAECRALCELNNREVPSWAPWHPVSVALDASSYKRLSALVSSS